MIIDNRSLFSDQQAVVATTASTNYYDLGLPGITNQGIQLKRSIAKGNDVPFLTVVDQDFNNLTSMAFVLQNSVDAAFTAPVEIFRINVPAASLKKGFILPIDKLPRNINLQFLQMRYEVTGAAPTQGTITSGIVASVDGSYQG